MTTRKMYNCWEKAAQYVPADADIVAFGGVILGQTLIPKLPQCKPGVIVVTIGQDLTAASGWVHPIQDCEDKFLTANSAATNVAKYQIQGLGFGTVYCDEYHINEVTEAMSYTSDWWLWLREFSDVAPSTPVFTNQVAMQWRTVPGLPAEAMELGGVQESVVFDPNWLTLYK
jgi:hypothetical protein